MEKLNENKFIFMAYNMEHIEVFKASQSFKQVFSIFNKPVDEINIDNESGDVKLVEEAIAEYIEQCKEDGEEITEYKCYMQF